MSDDTNVEIAVEVSGEKEAEKKLKDLARAQDEATEATKRNTEAARENATANDESSGVTNDAIGWLDKQKASLEGAGASTVAFGSSLQSLSALMKGDFVGAARAAGVALKSLGMAFVVNPVLASIAAIGAAVAALMKRIADTKSALVDLGIAAGTVTSDANHRHLERMGDYDYGKMSDEELAQKIKALEEVRDQHKRRSMELEDEAIEIANASDEILDKKGVENRTAAVESLGESAAREYEYEKKFGAELKRAQAEQQRRRDEEKRSADERAEAAASGAATREKDFTRRQQADAVEEKYGKAMRLQFEKQGLQQDYANETDDEKRLEIREKIYELERKISQENESQAKAQRDLERAQTASTAEKEFGKEFSLGLQKSWIEEDLAAATTDEERVKLATKLLQINKQIANEKERQAKADEQEAAREQRQAEQEQRKADAQAKKVQAEKAAQAEWMRGRKLDKMSAGDRVSFINDEISALRQQPGTIENRERMRKLVDERDAAKKDVDAIKEKKQAFLHRNDTDAQRLARIGKELGATDDQSKMLELMMAGEDLAENYQEPMTKRQQRRAEKKAERDAKAAMREARKFRKQVGEIEAAWAGGDKSVAEKVAGMTIDNTGTVSVRQMSKDGKVVKVEGQDLTNKLLNDIAKALT